MGKKVHLTTYDKGFQIKKKHLKNLIEELYKDVYKSLPDFLSNYTFEDAKYVYDTAIKRGWIA